jgi:sulfite exporter TauE/SafE
VLELTVPALMIAGVASSPHCALMCAPLQSIALRGAAGLPPAQALLLLHTGRVLGYAGLGAVAGALGVQGVALLPAADYGRALQLLAAAAILFSGVQLWRRRASCCSVQPASTQTAQHGWPRWRMLSRGVAWATVPCGLLYSVLFVAALSGGPVQGFSLLAAFGIGTVPLSGLGGRLITQLRRPSHGALHQWSGALLICIAMLSAGTTLAHEASGFAAWCLSR